MNERFPDPQRIYTSRHIARIVKYYKLKTRYDRLRDRGLLTQKEISELLGVNEVTVRIWREQGFLKACRYK